jgi:hypothetical protein
MAETQDFDAVPVTEGDYLKITSPHLTVGNRRLKVGEVIAVSEVGAGTAVQLVAGNNATWRKTPGPDGPSGGG